MVKDQEAITQIKENGALLGAIVDELIAHAQPGITTQELDALAEKRIKEVGGLPAFKGYKPTWSHNGFAGTICASINQEVVHGVPSSRVLKSGDLLGIDIGMQWPHTKAKKGYFTDTAVTFAVGRADSTEHQQLLDRTQQALHRAIKVARPGNSVADIGRAVEEFITPFGYGIVTSLVGHGVGYSIHEEPNIPNVYREQNESIKLVPGMVVALEPMITLGSGDVATAEDGWTIETIDHSYAAHFEHTIVIEDRGEPHIVTRRPSEK